MKKLIAATGLILIACVCIGAAAQPQPARQTASQTNETPPRGYVVKDWNGRVAVFRQGDVRPVTITQTRTGDLPKADARLIKDGIAVEDEQRLRRVLEDFCS